MGNHEPVGPHIGDHRLAEDHDIGGEDAHHRDPAREIEAQQAIAAPGGQGLYLIGRRIPGFVECTLGTAKIVGCAHDEFPLRGCLAA